MSISSIGNRSYYMQPYNSATPQTKKQTSENLGYSVGGTTNLTLHIGSDSTGKAATSMAFPNGVSISTYNTEGNDSEYKVKYWDEEGKESEESVNAKDVDPENASFLEMMAYSTYSDQKGYTTDASGAFYLASGGVNSNITYDSTNLNEKTNYKSLVKDFMDLQYRTNNYQGYLSFKNYYDYINENTSSSK
ncbi:MAG: hypothetical protein ACRC7V_11125 [Lachnospiraceae bacterium]